MEVGGGGGGGNHSVSSYVLWTQRRVQPKKVQLLNTSFEM